MGDKEGSTPPNKVVKRTVPFLEIELAIKDGILDSKAMGYQGPLTAEDLEGSASLEAILKGPPSKGLGSMKGKGKGGKASRKGGKKGKSTKDNSSKDKEEVQDSSSKKESKKEEKKESSDTRKKGGKDNSGS